MFVNRFLSLFLPLSILSLNDLWSGFSWFCMGRCGITFSFVGWFGLLDLIPLHSLETLPFKGTFLLFSFLLCILVFFDYHSYSYFVDEGSHACIYVIS